MDNRRLAMAEMRRKFFIHALWNPCTRNTAAQSASTVAKNYSGAVAGQPRNGRRCRPAGGQQPSSGRSREFDAVNGGQRCSASDARSRFALISGIRIADMWGVPRRAACGAPWSARWRAHRSPSSSERMYPDSPTEPGSSLNPANDRTDVDRFAYSQRPPTGG